MSIFNKFSSKNRQQKKRKRNSPVRRGIYRRRSFEQLEERRVLSGGNLLLGIPDLHSNPGASTTLFLDFDGHTEAQWGNFSNISTPLFDLDGDPTGMNTEEVASIRKAWAHVAEDFAPFDIDVTTEVPPELADGVSESVANGVALRVAIGGSGNDWFGRAAGGVSQFDSFTNTIPNVAFVFLESGNFGNTASHEAGHAFGLQHQSVYDSSGQLVTEYNRGDGNWAPIMGSSGAAFISTWHNGTTIEGSAVFQDEIAELGNQIGFRADDHGNSTATATPLVTDGTTFSGAGLITTDSDQDLFSFTLSTDQTVRMTLDVAQVGPNLDASLELRDASGILIAESSPANDLGAEVVSSLTAGNYFLSVAKVAEYGRVGSYTLSGSVVSPGPRIVSVDPAEFAFGESLSSLNVIFAEPVDALSFTTVDVLLTSPTGDPITVTGVNVVANTNNRQFEITYATQTVFGSYTIQIGPSILDLAGNSMNQDADQVSGEAVDDQFSSSFEFSGFAPGFAIGLGGAGLDRLWGMVGDADGNSYVTGEFSNTASFGGFDLVSQGSSDGFVAKINSSGDVLWAKRLGGAGNDRGYWIDIDSAGNVFVAGAFDGTADFGGNNITSAGGADSFISKLDQDGNFLWTNSVGDTGADGRSPRVKVDNLGNSFIRTSRSDAGTNIPVLAKFDNLGNSVWSRDALPASGGLSLATDSAGNVYTGGSFDGTSGKRITKLDTNGIVIWSVEGGAADIVENANGNIFTTGAFSGQKIFGEPGDSGFTTLTSQGSSNGYLSKIDKVTGELLWVHLIGDSVDAKGRGISADSQGNVIVNGIFSGTATYRGSDFTSAGGSDAFVLIVNDEGDLLSNFTLGGIAGNEDARNASVDGVGNLYVAGQFTGIQADFPAGTVVGAGNFDGFVTKLQLGPAQPAISVSPVAGLNTTEAGGSVDLEVVLDAQPADQVIVQISTNDSTEGTVSNNTLTFTTNNWQVPQTITITGVDDGVLDGDVGYVVTLDTSASADPVYAQLNPVDVAVTNLDDDLPPLAASENFETGNFLGGSGWSSGWTVSGDASIRTDAEHTGSFGARLRRSSGDLVRSIDTTGLSAVTLSFWGRLRSFENSDKAWVKVSSDGTNWTTIREFVNGEDDNLFHLYEFEIPVTSDSLSIRFDAGMSGSRDYWYIDDVQVVASGPANIAPVAGDDIGFSLNEDSSLVVAAAAGVLSNDSDADGDPLTAGLTSSPTNGDVTLNSNGSFTYTPNANFNGTDSFTYVANDGTTDSNPATVSITVNAINDAPSGSNNTVTVAEDTTHIFTATDFGFSDVDASDSLQAVTMLSLPATGSFDLSGVAVTAGQVVAVADLNLGNLSFSPLANESGTAYANFSFSVSDGLLSSSPANTLTIDVSSVNDVPVAVNENYSVNEDNPLNVAALSGTLANDSDADGDPLTAVVVTGPTNGSLTLNNDGSFSYTPDANFNGSDSFTYRANDGTADSNTATVSITVNPINDAPVAVNDSHTMNQDTSLNVAVAGVLANDSDADGDPLTAALSVAPTNGVLTLNNNGSFIYTPNAGFFGSDSFSYIANDGTLNSNTATVSITVNRINNLPLAGSDAYAVNEDNTLNVTVLSGLLANDSDADSDPLTAVVVTGPSNGSLTLNANGSFSYTPDANFNGADSFTYQANDGIGNSNTATVSITVNAVNDTPLAGNDTYNLAEDGILNISLPGVLANDSDVDGDLLTTSLVSGPTSGVLTLNPNGAFTYTPAANFHGSDSFTYEISDSQGGTAQATASITVTSVNDLPVAANGSITTNEDTPVVIDVLANDSDADGDPLTAVVVAGPSNGSLTLNANGSFSYTPDD